jgi:hypothetical protein
MVCEEETLTSWIRRDFSKGGEWKGENQQEEYLEGRNDDGR